jgi:hypothetical protein
MVLDRWRRVLWERLRDHRRDHPSDGRSDTELIHTLLEYLVGTGQIRRGDGPQRYRVSDPDIDLGRPRTSGAG